MAILFAASEPESFSLFPSSGVSASTTSTYHNSTMCRADTFITNATTNYVSAAMGNLTSFWVHFVLGLEQVGSSHTPIKLIDSASGTSRIQFELVGNTSCRLGYWNGSTFTYLTGALPSVGYNTYDIRVVIAVSGTISFYKDGVLVGTFTGDTTGIATSFSSLKFGAVGANISIHLSELIIADESTVGMNVCTLLPNGAGTTSQWTGAYTDISGTTYGDTTFISDSTNGDVSTFAASNLPSTSYDVIALSVNARASIGTSGPQNMQMALRTNSTNYFSGNVTGLSTAFGPVSNIWATSPDTSAAWTATNINALEIGVKAIT